jgi:hypothetical protein
MPLRRSRIPVSSMIRLKSRESEILHWMDLGGGIWCASQLADVSICTVMSWIEDGE